MTYFEVFIEFPDDFTVLLPFFLSCVGRLQHVNRVSDEDTSSNNYLDYPMFYFVSVCCFVCLLVCTWLNYVNCTFYSAGKVCW